MSRVLLVGVFALGPVAANKLKNSKNAYRKWDVSLNTLSAEIKKELAEGVFERVREDQRNWVRHKENIPTGAYLRVGMLDAEKRAEVVGIAKRGGSSE